MIPHGKWWMTEHTQSLLEDALGLPAGQRAELVHDLLASLEPVATDNPDPVAAAWGRELERRGHATLNGTAPGTEWETCATGCATSSSAVDPARLVPSGRRDE